MISVTVIGSGNVAYHLANAFLNSKRIKLTQLFTRNSKDLSYWKSKVPTTNTLESLEESDVTIIAISDDSIHEISKKIKNSFVVHTSGAKGINELQNDTKKGVFYPLQSFSKDKKVDFTKVPICIEAENSSDKKLLIEIANILGCQSYEINSEQRKYLHVAAVFANNFTNHMYTFAKDICDSNNVSFDILKPLIEETSKKIQSLDPKEAQTGPAVRNDKQTIHNHLSLLDKNQQELYLKITESIQKNGEKL